jgi:hypothetical protein
MHPRDPQYRVPSIQSKNAQVDQMIYIQAERTEVQYQRQLEDEVHVSSILLPKNGCYRNRHRCQCVDCTRDSSRRPMSRATPVLSQPSEFFEHHFHQPSARYTPQLASGLGVTTRSMARVHSTGVESPVPSGITPGTIKTVKQVVDSEGEEVKEEIYTIRRKKAPILMVGNLDGASSITNLSVGFCVAARSSRYPFPPAFHVFICLPPACSSTPVAPYPSTMSCHSFCSCISSSHLSLLSR